MTNCESLSNDTNPLVWRAGELISTFGGNDTVMDNYV